MISAPIKRAGLLASALAAAFLLQGAPGARAQEQNVAAPTDGVGDTPFLAAPMADAPALTRLSPDQISTITRIEKYLNEMQTVKSRFVQISSRGNFAEGDIFLQRPGRVRFEYDPPHPVLLIADGNSFLYYDKDLKNATFIPMEDSPLWFLIRDRVNLTDEVEIVDLTEEGSTISLTVRGKRSGKLGQVTLVFSDKPLELKKWMMTDAEGTAIQVALIEPSFSVPIDQEVFDYGDLDVYGMQKGPQR